MNRNGKGTAITGPSLSKKVAKHIVSHERKISHIINGTSESRNGISNTVVPSEIASI
jgi:hypothetical protein